MGMSLPSGGGRNKKPRPVPVMNVTPLVDVALVVLIIFMVMVPMLEKTFWLNLPRQDKSKTDEPDQDPDDGPLVMTIDRSGVIRINKAILRQEDIPQRLPRMLAAQPLPVLYFDAADNVSYGRAVEVMDTAKLSGAKAIAMLTEKVAD